MYYILLDINIDMIGSNVIYIHHVACALCEVCRSQTSLLVYTYRIFLNMYCRLLYVILLARGMMGRQCVRRQRIHQVAPPTLGGGRVKLDV